MTIANELVNQHGLNMGNAWGCLEEYNSTTGHIYIYMAGVNQQNWGKPPSIILKNLGGNKNDGSLKTAWITEYYLLRKYRKSWKLLES